MKRFKFLPIVIFLFGIAIAFIAKANDPETVWVYQNNGDRVESPNCSFDDPVCAIEFELNQDGTLGDPINEVHGFRLP